ncbi:two component transcriptional regulator, LuxR family [Bryocella elongata]|uniref:Two component transcriptional regulator, LuxR family n=1 Tax=Bryocella elongata TaxID=863522 RepID=A0A1H5ZBT6_9BACT|nr:response regulator transcription factor [Bryocella elongata]SEG33490.1 two component transcriptional regulator, LuxR family [Bryocella elongata]
MKDTSLQPIRIMTVDDHHVFREGVGAMLATQGDMELVAEASTGEQAVEMFAIHKPDITLMDLRLPGINGIDAMSLIRERFPQARMIVLTTYKGDVQALRAMKAGAAGYLLKSMLRVYMLDTIRAVHAGQRRIPPEIASEMAEHAGADSLTAREMQVLQHVATGNANKIIADLLSISEDTVKAHMKSILSKLSAKDRTHAVTIAVRRGFLDLQ